MQPTKQLNILHFSHFGDDASDQITAVVTLPEVVLIVV